MAHLAEVAIHPVDECRAAMPQLPRHREDTHRRTVIERLKPGSAVGVPKRLRANLPLLPAGALGNGVKQLSEVGDHGLPPRAERRKQQAGRWAIRVEHVGTQDRFELRPERNRFSSGVRWLREHEYVRQDDERGTWSPNQFTVEQDRAA